MARWKKIDSAPKGGKHVLLSCDADTPAWVTEGYYEAERDAWYQSNTHWTDACDGQCYPTHWMPMPSPFKRG